MNLGLGNVFEVKWCQRRSTKCDFSTYFTSVRRPASPGVTWWVWEWWMWDDLSKISIALHKSGVPPRPRLNWTLGCLEILEQKRELVRALITVVTSFHIVCFTCAMLLTSLHLPFSLLLRQNHHFSFDSHQYLCRLNVILMLWSLTCLCTSRHQR